VGVYTIGREHPTIPFLKTMYFIQTFPQPEVI